VTLDANTPLVQLPSYDWCGTDVSGVAALQQIALDLDEPPIPELVSASALDLPRVALTPAVFDVDGLARLGDPFVVTHAYLKCGWPHARTSAYLRRSALDRLAGAASMLPEGFGFAIWDAWRDPRLQAELHRVAYQDELLPPGFVNPPSSDPGTPPPHATGGTVDLTLSWDGRPLNLGTTFDAFVPAASSTAFEGASTPEDVAIRNLRRLLRRVLRDCGFVQLDCEWWHFEYGTRLWAAVKQTHPLYGATSPDAP